MPDNLRIAKLLSLLSLVPSPTEAANPLARVSTLTSMVKAVYSVAERADKIEVTIQLARPVLPSHDERVFVGRPGVCGGVRRCWSYGDR